MSMPFDWTFPYASRKMPVLAANTVATSQPLAAQAGLRMMLAGGNAVDSAIATAIALTVVEPVMNGIGGDMFTLVWHEGRLYGLNSSGRSPAAWTPEYFAGRDAMPPTGWGTVTVPGQVAGWKALHERFGKLPFAQLFEPAIEYAERGFAVSPTIARQWATQAPKLAHEPGFAEAFLPAGRAPEAGQWWRFPEQARTLREIAETGGESFYRGALAEKIAAFARQTGGALTAEDLAAHRPEWVEPISQGFRGYRLHEIPPNGQGISALIALGLLEQFDLEAMGRDSADYYHVSIEAMKLAFADLHHHVADPAHMRVDAAALLDPAYLAERARLIRMDQAAAPMAGAPKTGGTVYLTAADAGGTMVSFIQSNYHGFGSGVVVPGTGISLHNRGLNFVLTPGHANQVGPRKQPMHTIIPAFVTKDGQPVMSFGVMGGSMQAQGHLQMMTRLAAFGQNPQAMSDAPRFRVENGPVVNVESHLPADVVQALRARGHNVAVAPADSLEFGSAQLIHRLPGGGYVAASDSRRDGQAVGF
ncbi:gamma-glutamyltransferase [Bordetella hinzii]|uniref:Glutathione hydrolase proenzyme n=1 Tax=Bordetella hinzii TaxID=103855 RepID=A0AAN1RXW2_9BORD|nr:gamma-glutamyltransferase [Bordetella hinzii]AKQ56330.1 Putative gamma-glutamyltransferase YwrD [Bordetella hinzii]AKQ60861.1 Putative gamma-glutamyltransferase YwrD [Bordetella hinzii]AZW18122.1 gamma-glutamyltransferase [Bordetella hinzii]KCB32341.1 gamma-glutamyltransferase [Bordetella hinzii CA90 BAL1384]KXA71248.1 gamma-glutamyltransferase [Bordetella hinzii LMG 13501]